MKLSPIERPGTPFASRKVKKKVITLLDQSSAQSESSRLPRKPSAQQLAAFFLSAFIAFSLLPQIRLDSGLSRSFWAASLGLVLSFGLLTIHTHQTGRILSYEWAPRKVHYVQLLMHSSVYAYWGWYWREVYEFVPLILAQVLFAYAAEMIICWYRRSKWTIGFGPFPIVLSINLFWWFRYDCFFLQFILVGIALVGKELFRWNRDARLTHIFNPSALALFVTAVLSIALHATSYSRAAEIAFTLSYPPNIYLEIFIIGLVVQALFSVTLVTLAAISALCLMNLVQIHFTGIHQFADSNIPVLVFLGAHLLVTDPATSPRTNFGKLLFGALYGVGVFMLRGLLGWLSLPLFYDKLLCVPLLNLSVRKLDAIALAFSRNSQTPKLNWMKNVIQANQFHMALWIMLFTVTETSGFLSYTNRNSDPDLWRLGCIHGRGGDCIAWLRTLRRGCDHAGPVACFTLGRVLADGQVVPRDGPAATARLDQACRLGYFTACSSKVRDSGKHSSKDSSPAATLAK